MLPIHQGLTTVNFNPRGTNPTWIVLHYTANNGDTAANNITYFKSVYRGASANYFVDENSIWQSVKDTDTSWHVGNNFYNNGARNNNSIGIEMCSRLRSGGTLGVLKDYYIKDETVMNAVDLTRYLMKKYNIPIERVCRHYDVTGKYCPAPMVYNNGTITWEQFLKLCREEENSVTEQEKREMQEKIRLLELQVANLSKRYDYLEDVPEWARSAIKELVKAGIIKGVDATKDKGENVYVRLSYSECRLFYTLYTEGIFDAAIAKIS